MERKSAPEIARELGLKTHQVYKAAYFFELGSDLNPEFEISDIQDQIILGGILGDGNFKRMALIITTENATRLEKRNIVSGNMNSYII